MIAACAIAALIVATAVGVGSSAMRSLHLRTPGYEEPLLAAALGLGTLSLVVFAVGAIHAFYRGVAWGLVIFLFAAFRKDILAQCRRLFKIAARLVTGWHGAFEGALLAALLAAMLLNFVSSLAPPSESDSLTLHLVIPRDYIRAHAMVFSPDNWDSAMAFGPHMLYTLGILLANSVIVTAQLHFLVGCIFILWVWQFIRLRFGRRAAYVGASVLYNTPMISHVTIAPMIDMFFALYTFAAFVWLLDYFMKRRVASLALAGACAAFSANVKYTGLVVMAAVVVAAGLSALRGPNRLRAAGACAAAAAVAALVSSPYFVRNYVWTHNPFFPTMKEVFGGPGWDKAAWQTAALGDPRYPLLHHSAANMLFAPWLVTTDAENASGGISEAVGPAFLVLLPLALFVRSRSHLVRYMALYGLTIFVLTYWLSPRPRSRYFLSAMPIVAAYAGVGFSFLRRYSRPAMHLAQAVVLVSVLSGLAITSLYSVLFIRAVLGTTSTDAFLAATTDFYNDYRWMDAHLPPGSKVLNGATNNIYYLSLPSMRLGMSSAYTLVDTRDLYGLGPTGNAEEALRALKSRGLTHLFLPERLFTDGSNSASRILRTLAVQRRLQKLYSATGARGTRNPLAARDTVRVAVYRIVYQESP